MTNFTRKLDNTYKLNRMNEFEAKKNHEENYKKSNLNLRKEFYYTNFLFKISFYSIHILKYLSLTKFIKNNFIRLPKNSNKK